MAADNSRFNELTDIMARLRAEDGCPWDKKQTPQTLKPYLLEELHELLEAIDTGQPTHIMEELGDLMFLVVFVASIYSEQKIFSMNDVLTAITEKMIRRHPHVFSGLTVDSEMDLRQRWLTIKEEEREKKTIKPPRGLPKSLPALHRAQRVTEQASQTGFDWPPRDMVLREIAEQVAGLRTALSSEYPDQDETFKSMGTLLFKLANLGRMTNVNTENALSAATNAFTNRLNHAAQADTIFDDSSTAPGLQTLKTDGPETKKD